MRASHCAVAVAALTLAACEGTTSLTCGPGTEVVAGQCVPGGDGGASVTDGGTLECGLGTRREGNLCVIDVVDAGPGDAGVPGDGGSNDGGSNDGGINDGGINDGGFNDGGINDGGINDGGINDGGINDAGLDGGSTDAGATDAGAPDGGPPDAGASDAGAPGDRCATALPLTIPSVTTFNTAGFLDDYPNLVPGCSLGAGPDQVHLAIVPPGRQLVLSIGDAGPSAVTSVLRGPASACEVPAPVCLGNVGRPGDFARVNNEGTGPLEVFLISSSTNPVAYVLDVSTRAIPIGDTCRVPAPLPLGAPTVVAASVGFAHDFTACTGSSLSAPDHVFQLTVPAGERLVFTATVASGPLPLIALSRDLAACEGAVCLAQDAVGPLRLTWLNTDTTAATLYGILEGLGGADVTALATSAPPPAGDLCATAQALTPGGALTGVSLDGFEADVAGACGINEPERLYTVTVAPGELLRVIATPSASLNTRLGLLAGTGATCAAASCLGTAALGTGAGVRDEVVWLNQGGTAQDVTVVVAGVGPVGSTLDLVATVAPPGAGESCLTAIELPSDGGVLTQTLVDAGSTFFTTLPDLTYRVDVPAGRRATVTVTPSGFDPTLSSTRATLGGCHVAPFPLAGRSAATGMTPEVLALTNGGAAERPMHFIVEGAAAGSYTMSVALSNAVGDDTCENSGAPLINNTTLLSQSLTSYSPDYMTACNGVGRERARAVTFPALTRVRAFTSVMFLGQHPMLQFREGGPAVCDTHPAVCLAAGQPVDFINDAAAPRSGFLLEEEAVPGPYDLTVLFTPLPAGDTCHNAVDLTATSGVSRYVVTGPSGYTASYAPVGCTGTVTPVSTDRVFRFQVGAGETLTAIAQPTTPAELVLYLVAGPTTNCASATSCLAGVNAVGVSTSSELLRWTNAGTATAEVFLVVDYGAGSASDFDLAWFVTP